MRASIGPNFGPQGCDALPSIFAIKPERGDDKHFFITSIVTSNDDEQSLVSKRDGSKSSKLNEAS